jgi:hypothetical protein
MSDILGLTGFSPSSGNNLLIAAYGNSIVNVVTGLGYGFPIDTTQKVEFETFLNSLFFQNYITTPRTFNGTVWSNKHVSKLPLSQYLKVWNERLYLGYIKIGSTEYSSRVWYSNLPKNDILNWGYEIGTNLQTVAANTLVTSYNAGFKTYGLKRGDPLFILSGNDIGQYSINTVVDDQHLVLTEPMTTTASSISYWTGGNFFDVSRDDGDFITWLGENNNELLVFKRDSLWRYNGSYKTRVLDAVGTTSGRSVINLHTLTIYFHGASGLETGFYFYERGTSKKGSGAIEKYIDGISSNMYTSIVAWREGELYRAYVGDIENTTFDISIPKAVITYDYATDTWSVDPITKIVKAATQFRQSGTKQTYFGTSDAEVHRTPSGYSFNGSPIPFTFTTKIIYPSGTNHTNTFPRIEVISKDAKAVRVQYKLHLKPFTSDENFNALGQIDNEKTVLNLPEQYNMASGIQLRFIGIHPYEPTEIIKKITIYYKKENKISY